jgi:hypothetical protein
MARGNVSVDSTGVRRDADEVAAIRIRRTTRRILNRSTILCPVDTGRLRASGRMDMGMGPKGPKGTVSYPVQYAAAVHDGSSPHVIKARKAKVLRFRVGGRTVYARQVMHPGSAGRPFLRDAAKEVARAEGLTFRYSAR